jgi:hypothetical protein
MPEYEIHATKRMPQNFACENIAQGALWGILLGKTSNNRTAGEDRNPGDARTQERMQEISDRFRSYEP